MYYHQNKQHKDNYKVNIHLHSNRIHLYKKYIQYLNHMQYIIQDNLSILYLNHKNLIQQDNIFHLHNQVYNLNLYHQFHKILLYNSNQELIFLLRVINKNNNKYFQNNKYHKDNYILSNLHLLNNNHLNTWYIFILHNNVHILIYTVYKFLYHHLNQ